MTAEESTDLNNFLKKVDWEIHVPKVFPLVHNSYIFQNLICKQKTCKWVLPGHW